MIEMIFTISIILSLSVISISKISINDEVSDKTLISSISTMIEQARTYSLTTHKRVDLEFKTNSLTVKTEKEKILNLPKQSYFSDIKEIYYNSNGNINQANHINFNYEDKVYKIVFNLGSGNYYIK